MDLDAGACVLHGGLVGDDLAGRDGALHIPHLRVVQRGGRRIGPGAGQLPAGEHVRQHVLEGLEGADDAPELLPFLRVVEGQVERRFGDAQKLPGGQRSPREP